MPDQPSSAALTAGELLAVASIDDAGQFELFSREELDQAVGAIVQNLSDEPMTIHLADEAFGRGEGIVLAPAEFDTDGVTLTRPGGHWHVADYADVAYIGHHGAAGGTRDASKTVW